MKTLLLFLALLIGAFQPAAAQGRSIDRMVFFSNAATPAQASSSSTSWLFVGAAATASCAEFYGDTTNGISGHSHPVYARWIFQWNPRAAAGHPTSVALVFWDYTSLTLTTLSTVTSETVNSPLVGANANDITTPLATAVANGRYGEICIMVQGNGVTTPDGNPLITGAPAIFKATVDITNQDN